MRRDMTEPQFKAACKRHGFRHDYFGYYEVWSGHLIYARNGGTSRREQLAYLLKERERLQDMTAAIHRWPRSYC